MIYPVTFTLDSLISPDNTSFFLNIVYQSVGLFEIWIFLMEIIAISIVSELSYKKSLVIISSSWLISLMLTSLLGLKIGN